jgi:hypothetical protein
MHALIGMEPPARVVTEMLLEHFHLPQDPRDPVGKLKELVNNDGTRRSRQVGDQVGAAEGLPVLEVILDVVDDPGPGRDIGVVAAFGLEVVQDRELDGVPLGLGLGAQFCYVDIDLILNRLGIFAGHDHGQFAATSMCYPIESRIRCIFRSCTLLRVGPGRRQARGRHDVLPFGPGFRPVGFAGFDEEDFHRCISRRFNRSVPFSGSGARPAAGHVAHRRVLPVISS